MFSLTDRVALITGCGKPDGIGAATARLFASLGAIVVAVDIGSPGAPDGDDAQGSGDAHGVDDAPLVAQLRAEGSEALALTADVTSEADASAAIAAVLDRYSRLDILVNNAAAAHGMDRRSIEDVPAAAYRTVMDVNLYGTVNLCQKAIPVMRRQRYGRIVTISSVSAFVGMDRHAVYAASKAGVIGLTRSLAIETARAGITVNCVSPGRVMTSRAWSAERDDAAERAAILARAADAIPTGRPTMPEDVAAVVAFLATDRAHAITGQNLVVDGGASIAEARGPWGPA